MRYLPFLLLCTLGIKAQAQNIITVAGTGATAYTGDGMQATSSGLHLPYEVSMDTYGNFYIGDAENNRIRKVSTTGIISTVAGSGPAGYNGDLISATAAQLNYPYGVAVSAAGAVAIGDMENNRVRLITNEGSTIITIAGTGVPGYSGDGGLATAAMIKKPQALFWDAAGNIYFSDAHNNRVRKISNTGIITTIAGNGTATSVGDGGPATAAGIYHPSGLAMDATGNIYVAEMYGSRLRKISTSGIITTVAGTGVPAFSGDGGPASAAQLRYPKGVAIDKLGNILIADTDNQRVRKININTGIITTIAGTGVNGYSGDGGPATAAQLNFLQGLYVDPSGHIYIGDCGNNRVRKIICDPPVVSAITGLDTVCMGNTITLTSPTTGGIWSSKNAHTTVTGGTVTGSTAGLDTIVYTVANSCIAVSVIHPVYVKNCAPTFVAGTEPIQGVNIYPNPVANKVTISAGFSISDVSITDISGKIVFSEKASSPQVHISVAHLPKGVYLVKLNGNYSGRFVKM